MQKATFRKRQIQKLKAFAQTPAKKQEDQALLEKLMANAWVKASQTIGVTASLPFEVDTSKLIARLWDEGKDVFLAKARRDTAHTLDFLHYTYKSKLVKANFGIAEIAGEQAEKENNLDLVIVPGLAFALDNKVRLGFGGGYYDRFLEKYQPRTIAMANSPMQFSQAQWPVEKHDLPIQKIVTPDKIY